MTHAYKPSWSDFYSEGLGPNLPLTSGQQQQLVSGVLPSGESSLFDASQYHAIRNEAPSYLGSGINAPFPYPNQNTPEQYAFVDGENSGILPNKFSDEWWDEHGIIKTYPSDDGQLVSEERQSGIFNYNGSRGLFSNGEQVKNAQINDFKIFNNYIHHRLMPSTREPGEVVQIPYISTYRVSIDWNAYG